MDVTHEMRFEVWNALIKLDHDRLFKIEYVYIP